MVINMGIRKDRPGPTCTTHIKNAPSIVTNTPPHTTKNALIRSSLATTSCADLTISRHWCGGMPLFSRVRITTPATLPCRNSLSATSNSGWFMIFNSISPSSNSQSRSSHNTPVDLHKSEALAFDGPILRLMTTIARLPPPIHRDFS